MKKMTLTQMEQTQAQGWFGCTASMVGLGVSMIAIGLTGPVGGLALIGLLSGFAGISDCAVDALMY